MLSGPEKRWMLPIFIVFGVLFLLFIASKLGSPASAEAKLQASSNGQILAVPIQIGRDSYGIAMIDAVGQTLWVYEFNTRGPAHSRLRLLAARSWRYDRLLQQYNTAEPKPEQVKELLENLGRLPKQTSKEKQQDSDTNILEMLKSMDRDLGGQEN